MCQVWQIGTFKSCSKDLNELKLDRVGSVDKRPSTDNLQHFVTHFFYVTLGMWHVIHDTWHETHHMWYVDGGEHSLTVCDLWYF